MSTRLRRSLLVRLMGGAWFQWLLTLQLGFAVWVLTAGGALDTHWLLRLVPVLVPYLALWLAGITGWAEVDDRELRWRYLAPRRLPWTEIAEVQLTGRSSPGLIGDTQRIINVRLTGGGDRVITPAVSVGRADLTAFARAVVAAAHANGVAVRRAGERRWPDVPAP